MARIDTPSDWHPLRTDADWKARNRGGVIVVHQRNPQYGEAQTKYHGRNCEPVQHGEFLRGPATGTANAQWFVAPSAASVEDGGAQPCKLCDGDY